MTSNQNKGELPAVAFLSVDQMREVALVFQDAYAQTMANSVGVQHTRVTEFVANLLLTGKPYLMVTPEGLGHAVKSVYENPQVTDFVLSLYYTFGSRWGCSTNRYQALCANLTSGLVPHSQSPLCSTPNAVASRLASSPEDTYNLLVANPWLVVLLLLQLFISVSQQKPNQP